MMPNVDPAGLEPRVRELFNEGKSADQIADLLRERGIKGKRTEAYDCPVARFLKGEFGLAECAISGSDIDYTTKDNQDGWIVTSAANGYEGLQRFVRRFDRREAYQDLAEELEQEGGEDEPVS